jgi:CBS domain-containing protein
MRICDLIKSQETYHAEMGQSVLETVRAMVERNIGAVPVLHNGKLVGIFSERDLMKRVVAEGCDPRSTCLAEVMTDESAMRDNWSVLSPFATFWCTI